MSSSKKTKTLSPEKDEQIEEWYRMAQTKLKNKITENLKKRAVNSAQAINASFKHLMQDTQHNHVWNALFPNQSIKEYSKIFTGFTIPKRTIDAALDELLKKVDEWPGVDINSMNELPKDFKKYWQTSDNWWNRYKAEWIGDYFFYPLFQDALFAFVMQCTHPYTTEVYNKEVTATARIEYEQHATQELLYFTALRKILYAEVTFNRARAQPLILDQSFIKSECLQQFFNYLGHQHAVDWAIPPNDSKTKPRLHVRNYAREWTVKVLRAKETAYNEVVMRKPTDITNVISDPPSTPKPATPETTTNKPSADIQEVNISNDVPPAIQPSLKDIPSTSPSTSSISTTSGASMPHINGNRPFQSYENNTNAINMNAVTNIPPAPYLDIGANNTINNQHQYSPQKAPNTMNVHPTVYQHASYGTHGDMKCDQNVTNTQPMIAIQPQPSIATNSVFSGYQQPQSNNHQVNVFKSHDDDSQTQYSAFSGNSHNSRYSHHSYNTHSTVPSIQYTQPPIQSPSITPMGSQISLPQQPSMPYPRPSQIYEPQSYGPVRQRNIGFAQSQRSHPYQRPATVYNEYNPQYSVTNNNQMSRVPIDCPQNMSLNGGNVNYTNHVNNGNNINQFAAQPQQPQLPPPMPFSAAAYNHHHNKSMLIPNPQPPLNHVPKSSVSPSPVSLPQTALTAFNTDSSFDSVSCILDTCTLFDADDLNYSSLDFPNDPNFYNM